VRDRRDQRRGLASGPRSILRVILSIASVYATCVLTYRYVHGAGPRAVVGAAVSFFAVFLVCAITEPRAP
jgi:hypothetical protein